MCEVFPGCNAEGTSCQNNNWHLKSFGKKCGIYGCSSKPNKIFASLYSYMQEHFVNSGDNVCF